MPAARPAVLLVHLLSLAARRVLVVTAQQGGEALVVGEQGGQPAGESDHLSRALAQQKAALLAFKDALDICAVLEGDLGTETRDGAWSPSTEPCGDRAAEVPGWYGVYCTRNASTGKERGEVGRDDQPPTAPRCVVWLTRRPLMTWLSLLCLCV